MKADMPGRKRRSTSTSSFGSPGRASHDASRFYNSQLYNGLPVEQPVVYQENQLPDSLIDHVICTSSENLSLIPDQSVHLMVTSPPYNVGKDYDQDLSLEQYRGFLSRVWSEVYRVLVPGGRVCVNIANLGRRPYIPLHIYMVEDLMRAGFLMRGEIIWNKAASASPSTAWGSWRSAANPTLRDVHEYILVFSKGSFQRPNPFQRPATITKELFLESTRSVWTFPAESARKIGHPAPFPVELPRRLIELYTFEGEVVLDPFMGSGQTALAALQTHRHFIGVEVDPVYVQLAERRTHESSSAERRNPMSETLEQLLASLPEGVRQAILAQDASAFQCALEDLSEEDARSVIERLQAAGIIGSGLVAEGDFQQVLTEFDFLLQAIVAVAHGDLSKQSQVEAALSSLDKAGYHIDGAVRAIWSGERQASKLVSGLDVISASLVEHILALVEGKASPMERVNADALVASLPADVLAAVEAQDELAFQDALERLLPADRTIVEQQLDHLQELSDLEEAQDHANLISQSSGLPVEVRRAVLGDDLAGLKAALMEFSPDESQSILEHLQAAGLLHEMEKAGLSRTLDEFEPMLLAIAAVAHGDLTSKPQVEEFLQTLSAEGWKLDDAVRRIWDGERDFETLSQGLDIQNQGMVRLILDYLGN